MPTLPWKTFTTPDPDATYTAFVTKLPLTRHRYIPGFLRDSSAVRRQLADAPGLIAYSLRAELVRRTFWTVSVWEDEQQLRAFASADPHRSSTRRSPERMGASAFKTFTVRGSDLPLAWDAVRRQLVAS